MLIDHLNRQLREREGQGLRRQRRTAESPCAPQQRVGHPGRPACDLLAFCSNDYLGLANHPALVEALAEGARRYGAGSGASHLINGHSQAHAALEEDLAAWLAPCIPHAQALTFCTGYMANLALLTALGDASAASPSLPAPRTNGSAGMTSPHATCWPFAATTTWAWPITRP